MYMHYVGRMQKSSKPADAEAVVPLCVEDVVDYVGRIAPKWNKLALKLGLHPSEVQSLKDPQDSQDSKCLQVLQLAIEQGRLTSSTQLLEVLRSKALKMTQLAGEIENNISAKGTGIYPSQDGTYVLYFSILKKIYIPMDFSSGRGLIYKLSRRREFEILNNCGCTYNAVCIGHLCSRFS